MITGDWGNPKRIWGIEPRYDSGRMIQIYEAIKDLPINSVVDVACGTGIVADGLSWVMRGVFFEQFDIVEYPEWKNLAINTYVLNLEDFVKRNDKFDLVLFLNSYRNWDEGPKKQFDEWLKRSAKYFITSGETTLEKPGKIIGDDVKGHALKLYEL